MSRKVFLSYARSDDEPFVHKLREDLTKAGFTVWFDRRSMSSRGLTFHQEILDAIMESDRLILVVGPGGGIGLRHPGMAVRLFRRQQVCEPDHPS